MSDLRLNGTGPLAPRPGAGTGRLQGPTDAPAPAATDRPTGTGALDANALAGPAGQQTQFGLGDFATPVAQATVQEPKVFKLARSLATQAAHGDPTLDVRPANPGTIETVQAASVTAQTAPPSAPSTPPGLALAYIMTGELPTAAPQAAPVKRKRRRRRGFFRRIGGALKKGLKKLGGAVSKGIKAVGHFVAKYNPVSLGLKATAAVAGAVGLKGVAKALNKVGDFVTKVGMEIADGVAAVAKAAISLDTKDLKDWWKKNGSYVIMVASVVSMVVPGLQPLAVGLAAYQAYQGGKMMVEGIKTGDWKKAAMGLVSVAGAVAGGVTAVGAKALGSTATAIANTAQKVADYTSKAVKALDAIQNGDYGALVGMAAGAAANGLEFLGDGVQKFADSAKDFADKANTYYQNGKAAYEAFKNGDLSGGMASLMNLGTAAAGDGKIDASTLKTLETATRYVKEADSLAKAIKSGDVDGALTLVNAIAQQEGLTKGDLVDADKIKLAGQLEDLTKAIRNQDLGAAATLVTSLADEHGITIPLNDDLKQKFEQVKTYGGLVQDLQANLSAGNFEASLASIDRFTSEARKNGQAIDSGLTRELATLADAIKHEDQAAIQKGLAAVLARTVGGQAAVG